MGFFAIIFGYYGGGEAPVVVYPPNDGWIAETRTRVWTAKAKGEA